MIGRSFHMAGDVPPELEKEFKAALLDTGGLPVTRGSVYTARYAKMSAPMRSENGVPRHFCDFSWIPGLPVSHFRHESVESLRVFLCCNDQKRPDTTST